MMGCCADKSCTPKTCMNLPDGKTCGDCVHIERCEGIFGHTETDTVCDWFPRKFRQRDFDADDLDGSIQKKADMSADAAKAAAWEAAAEAAKND